jgi:hypothetical protein
MRVQIAAPYAGKNLYKKPPKFPLLSRQIMYEAFEMDVDVPKLRMAVRG